MNTNNPNNLIDDVTAVGTLCYLQNTLTADPHSYLVPEPFRQAFVDYIAHLEARVEADEFTLDSGTFLGTTPRLHPITARTITVINGKQI